MEELEGTAFPYGFESDEQTIKACLEFAFEGTGWHVGTCTVTKKRTIDEQESVTAWDVLQKCLTTYRCECIIRSLTKTIDIYDRIGSDRGCYFMEGLNLRKISLKSDTYDFYTRIYPIGKDGITPEWLTGKDYIDNFQYSSKIKAYVWKDERYTNTTSLIEDATAKIEEMSRPYKAYTAEVVDLAKASEEYKDILSYGIGDTVTLVSKKTRTKEKQRIVKITEYPETSEKNTVEISNARKTFAEIQKEETAAATEEAISISNRATKKVLENYLTTEEIETKITASKEAVEAGVTYTLKKYYTSDTYEVRALDGVSLTVEEGEFIAVVGTSGCGKTTLMNMLGGLDIPDFGGVWIRNTSLKDLNKEERTIFRRRNIGFVFQQYNLIPSLSIRENIVLPMRLDGKEIDIDFFNEIVEILGLKDKLERFPSTLSGGQQQRVAIARALAAKPAILLADEPTGNLDSKTSQDVLGLLKVTSKRFHQTIVMITHNEEIAQMADRILQIEDGKIVSDSGLV